MLVVVALEGFNLVSQGIEEELMAPAGGHSWCSECCDGWRRSDSIPAERFIVKNWYNFQPTFCQVLLGTVLLFSACC